MRTERADIQPDIDWGALGKKLHLIARKWLGRFRMDPELAEYFVGDAIYQVLDPESGRTWNRENHGLEEFLVMVLWSLIRNERDKRRRRAALKAQVPRPEPAASPEQEAYLREFVDALRKRVPGESNSALVLAEALRGNLTVSGQCESLGLDRAAVYRARHKLGELARNLIEDIHRETR